MDKRMISMCGVYCGVCDVNGEKRQIFQDVRNRVVRCSGKNV